MRAEHADMAIRGRAYNLGEIPLLIEPDAEERDAAAAFVVGQLDGRPYRFLLDTGAARSCVQTGEYIASLAGGGEWQTAGVFSASVEELVTVSSLELGPIRREHFTLVRTPAGGGKPSIIGMDLLKEYCCHFRFAEGRLIVSPGGVAAVAYHDLQLGGRGHPYLQVELGAGRAANAVWDTGAGITVADLGFIQRHPDCFEAAGVSVGTDSAGTNMETQMYLMKPVRIGDRQFPAHRVAGVDLAHVNARADRPMDLILGYNLFGRANWLMDFPNKRWAFTGPEE